MDSYILMIKNSKLKASFDLWIPVSSIGTRLCKYFITKIDAFFFFFDKLQYISLNGKSQSLDISQTK